MSSTDRIDAGFSLIDLLAVIIVFTILFCLLIPTTTDCGPRRPHRRCMTNLKEIGRLSMWYADEHQNMYPHAKGTDQPAYAHLQKLYDWDPELDSALLICPLSTDLHAQRSAGAVTLEDGNNSYAFNKNLLRAGVESRTILASDDYASRAVNDRHPRNHIMVVYVDSRVESLPYDESLGNDLFDELVGDAK